MRICSKAIKFALCKDMVCGDQQFYWDLGFTTKAENEVCNGKRRFKI